ncbi:LamG domain-containing protein [Polyangium aurulentum]|uniref:LamG domain-containing protein n=1 Tax=Polyangium aurulentum TaxID=2567896 RepID=UPI0010AEB678|nr:LamG domain-containing protein [Polyangium aurulentum]UQA59844.1 LamG domain-containing protein [Polyangium aurulentum]
MPLNTWIHAACVFGGGKLRLNVNGDLTDEVDAQAPSASEGLNAIGANAPSGDSLDGLIDGVRVWKVARYASECC